MEDSKLKLTILMMSFDSYHDVWDGFYKCKEKYWPDCAYPTVQVTCEEVEKPDGADRLIAAGADTEWTERLHTALEEIDSQYVFLMLEDLYIDKPVDNERIEGFLSFLEQHPDVGHLRLYPDIDWQQDYEDVPEFGEYVRDHAYRITTHPAIWRREYLLRLSEPVMDAWNFEYRQSFASNELSEACLTTKDIALSFTNTIWRGLWTKEGMELCKKVGIPVDLSYCRKHSVWSNLKTRLGEIVYILLGAERVTRWKMKRDE